MNTSQTLTKAASAKIARQLNTVRQKKIQALRNKISSGRYKVSNFELAKALFLAR